MTFRLMLEFLATGTVPERDVEFPAHDDSKAKLGLTGPVLQRNSMAIAGDVALDEGILEYIAPVNSCE